MRTIALLFVVGILVGALPGRAQGVRAGLKAGVSLCNVVGGKDRNAGTPGVAGGLLVNLPLTPAVSVQPELLFAMQGYADYASFGAGFGAGSSGHLETINYVQVPVLVRGQWRQAFLEAGPQVGVLVSDDADDVYRRTDLAGNVGLGIQDRRLAFSLRYSRSLRDIYSPTVPHMTGRHRVFLLAIDYYFGQ